MALLFSCPSYLTYVGSRHQTTLFQCSTFNENDSKQWYGSEPIQHKLQHEKQQQCVSLCIVHHQLCWCKAHIPFLFLTYFKRQLTIMCGGINNYTLTSTAKRHAHTLESHNVCAIHEKRCCVICERAIILKQKVCMNNDN